MSITYKKINSAENLDKQWDVLSSCFFQQKEFLLYNEKFNPCEQRYYEIFKNESFVGGAVVYSIKAPLCLIFKIPLTVKLKVVYLPVSVTSSGIVGIKPYDNKLISHILKHERGIILGMNLDHDFKHSQTIVFRTYPSLYIPLPFKTFDDYLEAFRAPYRRRILNAIHKFSDVNIKHTSCVEYTMQHHYLYLQIMHKTETKLETLHFTFFRNLPESFTLTSYYRYDDLICWHICFKENKTMTYFFGGMDYQMRNKYYSYYKNLIGAVKEAISSGCHVLELGQTAELPKMRLGARIKELKMFVYHRNPFIMLFFKIFKRFIEYSVPVPKINPFKKNLVVLKK